MRRTLFPAMAILAAGFMMVDPSAAAAQTPTVQPKTPKTDTATAANVQLVATYLTDRLKNELNLTPEQIPKVQEIATKSAGELERVLRKYDTDTSASSDKALVKGMVSTLHSSQQELKKVLTPAQWTQHQANRAQRIALNQTEIMAYTLDLTRQQILDVERINMESANKLVRALDQPASAPKRTNAQVLELAKPTLTERDSALAKVLTKSQWTEMQENRRALRDLLLEDVNSQVATTKPTKY
jgi:hypothetical protein